MPCYLIGSPFILPVELLQVERSAELDWVLTRFHSLQCQSKCRRAGKIGDDNQSADD